MSNAGWHRPYWMPEILWIKCKCPRCNSVKFKAAELRPFDGVLSMFALHPVRCGFCWRRYYWVTLRGVFAR